MAKLEYRNGSWSSRVSLTDPATGKRRQERITGRTKTEVKNEIAELVSAHNKSEAVSPAKTTVASFVESWISGGDGRVSTQVRNTMTLRKHIVPDPIGAMKIQHVRPLHVQEWIDRLSQKLEPSTVRTVYAVLRGAMTRADALEVIARTPCRGIRLPKVTATTTAVLSEDEARRLIEDTADDHHHVAWVLMAVTGLRIGEVLALTWSNVDFEQRTLRVEHTMTRKDASTWVIGTAPKTDASRRSITLPAVCIAALRNHRKHQLERRLMLGSDWGDSDAILDNGTGGFYANATPFTRRWKTIKTRLELPADVTIHGLRHTAASLAIKNGVPITTISRMLGHANPSITLRVYAHIYAAMEDEAAALLDTIYAPRLERIVTNA